jgi:hypothetical protein|tara:strand:- start:3239 stop:3718 length:480 start_codon:yes stop_codon:yes gene_type:complete
MKIIDNLLDKDVAENIANKITSDFFPWFYQNNVTDKSSTIHSENYYFTHLFYDNNEQSSFFNYVIPILKKIKYKKLIRVKANLYPNVNKLIQHSKHIDYNYPTKGALYYLNTNNGPTYVENKKIDSVKNRLLLFNAFKKHNSTTCTDKKFRVNININYL